MIDEKYLTWKAFELALAFDDIRSLHIKWLISQISNVILSILSLKRIRIVCLSERRFEIQQIGM